MHMARVPVHRALIRALEHRLFAEETLEHPILDIGCGDGHFAAAAFCEGVDAGVDVTWSIISEAAQYGPYRHLAVADGTCLPYADASFRTVVSNCVIEHIPDIEALVSEVSRVLLPGGRFVFSVPNHRFTGWLFTVRTLKRFGLRGLADRYGRWWNEHAAHFHLDAPDIWEERLMRHGLRLVRQADYMSQAAMKVFELAHFYAVPSVIWHRFSGRWSLRTNRVRQSMAYRWLAPYAEEQMPAIGACSFFVACKR